METGEVLSLDSSVQGALLDLQQQQLILSASSSASGGNGIQIQEPQRGIEMIEFFRKQREREKFCDVILHVQGKQFYAHRMVLAAGSAYFDSIFKAKKTMREHLAVSCQDPEIFSNFLNYFYTGSILLKKENVGELIRLSHHFLVNKLKAYCANFLERFIDVPNCLQVKLIAERFSLPTLGKITLAFVQQNLGEVINHEIMMDLPPKQIEQFVTEKAYGLPHDAAVKFMSRWICHDISTRERDFKQFLTHIDWTSLDPNSIVDYIDQEPLYGASERCFYYVLHSLAMKGIQIQKYEPMYQALDQRFGQETDTALGYGDNLLQMAFNSAMEGLTDSTSLLLGENNGNSGASKWTSPNNGNKTRDTKLKLPLSLEQRRRRILFKIHKNRSTQKWVRLLRNSSSRRRRKKREQIVADCVEESSGEEEVDPVQSETGYRCHLCPFSSKKISRLERHISGTHGHDVVYRCSECGFSCKWNRDYFMHMKSHYDGPPFKCSLCVYQCMKIGSLICHKMSHLEQKQYQCCDCEYKCRTKANLAAHIKLHNNEKPYRCNICGRTFASKNSLDQHALVHNHEKVYHCSVCSFTTKSLGHLNQHKKTHSSLNSNLTQNVSHPHANPHAPNTLCVNVQPPPPPPLIPSGQISGQVGQIGQISGQVGPMAQSGGNNMVQNAQMVQSGQISGQVGQMVQSGGLGMIGGGNLSTPVVKKQRTGEVLRCSDSQCKYTTNKKSQLDSHMRSHAGVRPHPCSICGRRFLEKSHLVRHERIHYNERPFKCEECDYASTRRDKLKEHKSRHHGVNASAKSPYKPRPHKNNKASTSFNRGSTPIVYAKKTTVEQAGSIQASSTTASSTPQTQESGIGGGDGGGGGGGGSELEFIIPHENSASGAYTTQLVSTGTGLELGQMGTPQGIVQIRQYQPGKPEIQVAHTLASIPSSITAAELQRVGLKLEDLQSQGLIQGRAIKLEDLGNVAQARLHGPTATMVIDAAQLQQLQAAVANFESKPHPMKITSQQQSGANKKTTITVTTTTPQQQQQQQISQQGGNETDFLQGMTFLDNYKN